MKITKETHREARQIRQAAANRFGCEVSEINYRMCLSIAMKAKSVTIEEIEKAMKAIMIETGQIVITIDDLAAKIGSRGLIEAIKRMERNDRLTVQSSDQDRDNHKLVIKNHTFGKSAAYVALRLSRRELEEVFAA